ncbi:MAG: CHAT domain-containing protein, partial [Chloroflexi bacterium]|nr:CHAT domain-containing protein [Chloroflexota bacterium]MCI0728020.1 CHAT domain-containing protein [Chloroflexota bacterium]
NQAFDVHLRNPREGLQAVDVAEAVALAMGTSEAEGLAVWVKGNTYLYLNRYEEALACFQRGEAIYTGRGESLKVVGLQVNQVAALREMADYQAALVVAKRARAGCLELGEPAEKYLANLEMTLGWILQEMGDPETALATYDHGRAIFDRLDDQVSVALIDVNRAYVLESMDRVAPAEAILLQARAVLAEAGFTQEVARADLNLGQLAYRQGHYHHALRHLDSAYSGFAAIPLPVEVAVANLYRITVYRDLNLLEEIIHLARQAGQVFKRHKMGREYIRCLINEGVGYQRLNLLPQAERALARARRLLYQQGAQAILLLVDADRAELALAGGRINTAWRLARRLEKEVALEQRPALAVRVQLLLARCSLARSPADQAEAWQRASRALKVTQEYHLPAHEVQAYHLLGQVLEADGHDEEAWRQVQRAVVANERLRAYLLHDEFQIGFMEDKLPVYVAHVRLAHKLVSAQKASQAELLHSLSLAQTAPLLQLPVQTAAEDSSSRARLAELRQSWHWYQSKLDLPDRPEAVEAAAVAAWRRQLRKIEQEMGELMRLGRLRKTTAPAAAEGTEQAEPAALLAEVQSRLGPQDVLLQYYVVQDHFQALLVDQTGIHLGQELVATPALERLLRAWRFYLRHAAESGRPIESDLATARAYLARLYQMLLAPLEAHLAGRSRVYLVLPPEWHDTPAPALFDGNQYFVERFQLVYLSTPRALPDLQAQFPAFPATLAKENGLQAVVVGFSDGGRLPHAVQEARLVALALTSRGRTTSLLEEEATGSRFRSLGPECQLLHLATHAVFRPDNPLFSSIRLADGRMTVADLYEMVLTGRPLVVLSACETGRGRPRGGGLLGMGRGFLAAGASGLVATLWPVSDAASAELMAGFYRTLLSPHNTFDGAAALRAAQLAAIAQRQPPFHWAGFIFIGG